MKNLKSILLIISVSILILQSCNEEQSERIPGCCTYELTGPNGRDTINLVDVKALKQGIWIKKRSLGYKTHKILDVAKDTVIFKANEIVVIDTTYYKDGVEQKNKRN